MNESIIIIVSSGFFLLILWAIVAFRYLKGLATNIDLDWQKIQLQLSKRHNLIPLLIETIRKHSNSQEDLLKEIITVRSQAMKISKVSSQKIILEHELSKLINRLIDLGKIYKEIAKDITFLEIRSEINKVEDMLEVEVNKFNNSVIFYNNKVNSFLFWFIAKTGKLKEKYIFEIEK